MSASYANLLMFIFTSLSDIFGSCFARFIQKEKNYFCEQLQASTCSLNSFGASVRILKEVRLNVDSVFIPALYIYKSIRSKDTVK